MHAAAADQAGNDRLEGGVRGKLLGFRRDLRHVCLLCSGFVPVQCGTVEVCVVFLDTLTIEFELYVWLRERRQWDSDFPEFVFSRLVLRLETLEVPGMDLQLCVYRCGVGWSPQLFDFFLVERQLDLSSSRIDSFEVCHGVGTVVTAVVVCGVPEWWHSFGYGWYLYPVVWCDLPLNVLYPSSGLAVCLACSGIVSDLYHQQLSCS
ncbi:hypothetical protein Taro_028325 [Colocasia esculenta]|uniref:Uncharacterized protein n=1 Tax=Colocasia esculenta TaxID=4460 RepID=A0A843VG81_COLES|nr:hypothetical protein [Colocasia esculenta]